MTTKQTSSYRFAVVAVALTACTAILSGCSGSGSGGGPGGGSSLYPVKLKIGANPLAPIGQRLVDPSHAITLPNGDVIVSDMKGSTIKIYGPDGTYIETLGSLGKGPGQFEAPEGLCLDAQQNLYVVDSDNTRVQVFQYNAGTNAFTYLRMFGDSTIFQDPEDVVVDASGNCYVVDDLLNKVVVFDSTGAVIRTIGKTPGGFTLTNPLDLALDGNGHLYVADTNANRIVEYTTTGVDVAVHGGSGSQPGQFNHPIGLGFGPNHHLFVYDAGNSRVQEFTTSDLPVFIYNLSNPGVATRCWAEFAAEEEEQHRAALVDIV